MCTFFLFVRIGLRFTSSDSSIPLVEPPQELYRALALGFGHINDGEEECKSEPATKGKERQIKVGYEFIYMDLTKKKSTIMEKEKKREKPKNVRPRHDKMAITLPEIYRILSPVEFVIYSAIKEVKEVGGVEELSRHLGISNKTILLRLKKLVDLNLVKREFVSCGSGSYLKITLVNDSVQR